MSADGKEAQPEAPPDSAFPAAFDERRDAPRFPLNETCTVFVGPHVYQASVRDVSAGGAMLHGVPGVIVGDLVRLRLLRLPDHPIEARVRGISLVGVHVAIEGALDQAIWRRALKDVLG